MATYSTKQVKQFYVAKTYESTKANVNAEGDVHIEAIGDDVVITHYGKGGITRSDLINKNKIKSVTAIKAGTMKSKNLPNAAYVACGKAIAGQQYIMTVKVRNYCSLGDEDTRSFVCEYKASSSDAVKNILANLAVSLAQNTKGVVYPLFKIYAVYAADGSVTTGTEVTASTSASSIAESSGTAMCGIYIVGAEQDWKLGTMQVTKTNFEVNTNVIIDNGDDYNWGTVTFNTTNSLRTNAGLVNSKEVADMEWFCMKERADVYGMVGWPNVVETKYMVDSARTTGDGYDLLTIHYAFTDGGNDVQESEKTLILACESDSTYTSGHLAYAVITALNTATGRSDSWA